MPPRDARARNTTGGAPRKHKEILTKSRPGNVPRESDDSQIHIFLPKIALERPPNSVLSHQMLPSLGGTLEAAAGRLQLGDFFYNHSKPHFQ